ncbi:MAG: D-alanyl-D-alanine carboxypeptidase family protein [Gammaproteobacteria bacterium]|nr:D-alanyl-D-alanine carboxypeptidase family protein [Gammaproteobacteria bacterium]
MEASRLVSIGPDVFQREQFLAPGAAKAWRSMADSAVSDKVELQVVSAFRSFDYQEGIIRRKLEKGQAIGDILQVSAAPGYSEHHTGRAVDITTPGFAVLEEEFETSDAFAWLTAHAKQFGFRMSFPRGNPHGVAYEPWHWAWRG